MVNQVVATQVASFNLPISTRKTKLDMQRTLQPPSRLDTILEKFNKKESKDQEEVELLNKIIQAKIDFSQGRGDPIIDIHGIFDFNPSSKKEEHQKVYIDCMGMALWCHERKHYDTAWYHYARAQYCLGVYQSWDRVLDYFDAKDRARQDRAKGGKAKNHKHLMLLKDALIKVATDDRPPDGWQSKKQLINAALPTLEEIINKNGDDSFPLHENIGDAAKRWLKNDIDVRAAYIDNAALSNKDAELFR